MLVHSVEETSVSQHLKEKIDYLKAQTVIKHKGSLTPGEHRI